MARDAPKVYLLVRGNTATTGARYKVSARLYWAIPSNNEIELKEGVKHLNVTGEHILGCPRQFADALSIRTATEHLPTPNPWFKQHRQS